jgi:hypothetical protein
MGAVVRWSARPRCGTGGLCLSERHGWGAWVVAAGPRSPREPIFPTPGRLCQSERACLSQSGYGHYGIAAFRVAGDVVGTITQGLREL